MGVQSRLDNGLSLTLGGSSVSLYEMTGAFGVLVNKGVRAQPYAIERVLDSKGGVLFEHQPEKQDALEPATADTVVAMLKGVVRFGTGRGADIGRPAAGKTGTSDQNRDAWFIGFTPDIVTGVWVGNDNNTSMPGNMSGGTLPAAIWRAYMSPLLASRPPQEFDLAYSKTITDQDFTTYNPENIASQDVGEAPTDDAMAAGAEGAVGGDGGEVPPDAAGGGESPETSHDAMPDATEPPRYTPSQDDIPVPRYVPGGGSSGSRGAASTQQPVYSGGTGNGFPAALPANPPPAYGHPATNGTIGPNGAMAPPPPRRASRIDPAAPMEIPSGQ
jgi:penicillin-binding protein 1A